jgi:hypothetical protein
MPAGAINEKTSLMSMAAADAVRKAVKRSGTKVKHAAVAIGGAAVITKVITMPGNLSDGEMGEQIEEQADQYIPFPLEEVSYDYEVIGPIAKRQRTSSMSCSPRPAARMWSNARRCLMRRLHGQGRRHRGLRARERVPTADPPDAGPRRRAHDRDWSTSARPPRTSAC